MDIYVVVALEAVTLEALPRKGLTLDDDCIVFPDKTEALTFVDLPLCESGLPLRQVIGEVARNTIRDAGAVVFITQASETDIDDAQARRLLMRVMALTEQLLFMLWLVKDNSGNTGDGFIALGVPGKGIRSVFTQRPGGLNFTAECDRRQTPFSIEEVETAVRYFEQFSKINPQIEWRLDAPRPSGLIYKARLIRTMYFAQAARQNAEIGVKLAFYCICFESLFAGESDSISHRVAERAAILLASSGEKRQAIYRDIRKLYSIRSKVVHGASLNADQLEALREVSKTCDEHLRRAVRRILDDAELLDLFTMRSSDAIDTYFIGKLFPASPPGPTAGTQRE